MENQKTDINPKNLYVPFDEYIYRRIIDMCLDFCDNYQNLNTERHTLAVSRCENIFEGLMDFASDCKELPMDLRDPPISEWCSSDGMPRGPDSYVIHQRRALDYVMRLMNELKRQQSKKGRDPDELVKKYGLNSAWSVQPTA